jgi:hypothetical protein
MGLLCHLQGITSIKTAFLKLALKFYKHDATDLIISSNLVYNSDSLSVLAAVALHNQAHIHATVFLDWPMASAFLQEFSDLLQWMVSGNVKISQDDLAFFEIALFYSECEAEMC